MAGRTVAWLVALVICASATAQDVERKTRHMGTSVPTVEEILNALGPPCEQLPGCTRSSATGENVATKPVQASISSSVVTFDTGSAKLTGKATQVLDNVVKALGDTKMAGTPVKIEGHADKRGGDELNSRLSQERADAVVAYLTGKGVDKSRLSAEGKGSQFPLDLDDPTNSLNRRVEFVVTYAAGSKISK